MKQTLSILTIFLHFSFATAQNTTISNRTITITGSAEANVKPDKMELQIITREYQEDKKTRTTVDIENEILKILEINNIDIDLLIPSNTYWLYWWRRRANKPKTNTYSLVLDQKLNLKRLFQQLDIEGIQSISITQSLNSNIEELRKQVKVMAVKAAKEKAKYLLKAVDEDLGRLISIEEIPEKSRYYWHGNTTSNISLPGVSSTKDFEDVKSIKLRYEVRAVFEILQQ